MRIVYKYLYIMEQNYSQKRYWRAKAIMAGFIGPHQCLTKALLREIEIHFGAEEPEDAPPQDKGEQQRDDTPNEIKDDGGSEPVKVVAGYHHRFDRREGASEGAACRHRCAGAEAGLWNPCPPGNYLIMYLPH